MDYTESEKMRSTLFLIFVSFIRLALAICHTNDAALWRPNPGDTFGNVLRPLGISVEEFQDDNKDVGDVNYIDYATTYCVPYITSLTRNYYTTSGTRYFSAVSVSAESQKTVGSTIQAQTQSTKPEQSSIQTQPVDSSPGISTTDFDLTMKPTATKTAKTAASSTATAAPQLSERKCCAQRDRDGDLTNDFQTQAKKFCNKQGIYNFYPGSEPRNGTGDVDVQVQDEDYVFFIRWVASCDRWQFQNGLQPVAYNKDITCLSVMSENFSKCGGKKSNGGYMDVGCLRYSSRAKGWALDGGPSG